MGATETGPAGLTERQQAWFAAVKAGLERDTGRSLEAWVEIARTCPHPTPKARRDWLRTEHGLGQNRAAQVLAAAFPGSGSDWSDGEALRAALWTAPGDAAILAAVEAAVGDLADTVTGQRKAFTAFSRKVQMAAARPARGGGLVLGLAVEPDADPRLEPRGRSESWGDRLKAQMTLSAPGEVDDGVRALLAQAWARS